MWPPAMWSTVLVMAAVAAIDPLRIGVVAFMLSILAESLLALSDCSRKNNVPPIRIVPARAWAPSPPT